MDTLETQEIKALKEQISQLQKEAENNLAGWKRAKADYINLQRQIEEDKQSWADFASLNCIMELIPLWQSFDQLINNLPPSLNESLNTGLKQIQKMLADFFKKNGVEKIKTEGEKFDPEWHEAVEKQKVDDINADIIVKEITPGYKMNNKLIIPPKVIVGE